MTTGSRFRRRRRDSVAPAFLGIFFAGTLVMVLAVVAIARIDTDWADAVAVAILAAVAAVLLVAIGRQMAEPPADDDGNDALEAASGRAAGDSRG